MLDTENPGTQPIDPPDNTGNNPEDPTADAEAIDPPDNTKTNTAQ